jgi:putative membrane protein
MGLLHPISLALRVVVTALTVLAVTKFIDGIAVSSFQVALVVALVLGLFHLVVRPILLLLTFPITLLTFGLFTFVINGLLLYVVQFLVPGFTVDTLIAGFLGALIISAISTITHKIIS